MHEKLKGRLSYPLPLCSDAMFGSCYTIVVMYNAKSLLRNICFPSRRQLEERRGGWDSWSFPPTPNPIQVSLHETRILGDLKKPNFMPSRILLVRLSPS